MKNELRPHAVIYVEGTTARICAWCPDKLDAEVWAEERVLTVSHGICPTCRPRLATEVIFEAGERCVAPDSAGAAERRTALGVPSRLVVFSCRLGGGKP